MPVYEYECAACGHAFEEWQKINDGPVRTCPKCGKEKVERLISQTAFMLKGGRLVQGPLLERKDANQGGRLGSGAKAEQADQRQAGSAKGGGRKGGGDKGGGTRRRRANQRLRQAVVEAGQWKSRGQSEAAAAVAAAPPAPAPVAQARRSGSSKSGRPRRHAGTG